LTFLFDLGKFNLQQKGVLHLIHFAMFELSKQILEKVSFDKVLFKKELHKALKWLKEDERVMFKVWCLATFGQMYGDVIKEVFRNVTKT